MQLQLKINTRIRCGAAASGADRTSSPSLYTVGCWWGDFRSESTRAV